jgi:hypothetical protein
MTDLTTLQSLRDRVANATGPMLGGPASDIADALHPVKDKSKREAFRALQEALGDGSIDAALAWVERVLPGRRVLVSIDCNEPCWAVVAGTETTESTTAITHTPALAIILAGLDALIAKEKTDGTA